MAMRLKMNGFTLLMDDFGSGYSSLNVLLEKLILEHTVSMSQELGLGLLAEGAETKEQVALLDQIGCDHVQGYYFAKPMPQDEFFELLKKDRGI